MSIKPVEASLKANKVEKQVMVVNRKSFSEVLIHQMAMKKGKEKNEKYR